MTDRKKNKTDVISDRVLENIRNGRWKVGDKLPPEAELAAEFNVSRVSLREGMQKLSVLGVVDICQGRGTYISELNPSKFVQPLFSLMAVTENNIKEIYDARIAVESDGCKLAALNRTEENIRVLRHCIDNMDEAITFNNYAAYSELDRRFHDTLMLSSCNHILLVISRMFGDMADIYTQRLNQNASIIQQSMMDHRQLYYAIVDQNGEFSRHIMQVHLERSRNALLSIMEN